MTGQNFNASSFFEQGKACPNCNGKKWVGTGTICPICQGTGAEKVPMPNIYDNSNQGPFPPMNQSLLNRNVDKPLPTEEVLDTLWDDTPDYIVP